MIGEVVKRIEARLTRLGMSAAEASKLAGKPDAIRNMQRAARDAPGRKGANTATISALAPVLKTTIEWLLEGRGPEEVSENPTVPLVGYVGAGAETHAFGEAQGELDRVAAPLHWTPDTVEVRGQSLGAIFDGWLVYYDERHDPPSENLIGQLCVVGLSDGRVLIKRLQRGSLPNTFTLISQFEPPIYDVVAVWAAKVKSMEPR